MKAPAAAQDVQGRGFLRPACRKDNERRVRTMMTVQVPMWSDASDAELQFYREMGIEAVSVMFRENDWDYDSVCRTRPPNL